MLGGISLRLLRRLMLTAILALPFMLADAPPGFGAAGDQHRSEVAWNDFRCPPRPEAVRIGFDIPWRYNLRRDYQPAAADGCNSSVKSLSLDVSPSANQSGCGSFWVSWDVFAGDGSHLSDYLPSSYTRDGEHYETVARGALRRPLHDRDGRNLRRVPGGWIRQREYVKTDSGWGDPFWEGYEAYYEDSRRNRFYRLGIDDLSPKGCDDRAVDRAARVILRSFGVRRTDEHRRP
jgi:hypothetical protein